MQQTGVSEERIVEVFSKVFAVIIYAEGVCANENFTSNQLSQAGQLPAGDDKFRVG